MAQLEAPAAVVADDSVGATVEQQTTTEAQQEEAREPTGEEMYPDDGAGQDQGEGEGESEAGAETGEEDDQPEIRPPHSLKAEEKEAFAKLPREAQEFVARRITEVDKFAESKAREAQTARATAEREAIAQVQQIAQHHAQSLEQFLPQIHPRPSYQLQVDDPIAFADHMDAHERSIAQYQAVQQQIAQAKQQAGQAEEMLRAQAQQDFRTTLTEKLPEFFDEQEGPKLREQLGSIALELGYPQETLAQADATDILAMKAFADLKAERDSLKAQVDSFNRTKMEAVRAAKNLPRIAKPGAAQGARVATDDPAKLLYPND